MIRSSHVVVWSVAVIVRIWWWTESTRSTKKKARIMAFISLLIIGSPATLTTKIFSSTSLPPTTILHGGWAWPTKKHFCRRQRFRKFQNFINDSIRADIIKSIRRLASENGTTLSLKYPSSNTLLLKCFRSLCRSYCFQLSAYLSSTKPTVSATAQDIPLSHSES